MIYSTFVLVKIKFYYYYYYFLLLLLLLFFYYYTGTCLHKELVADARVVDVVYGCREDDRKCLKVRHNVLRDMDSERR